MAKSKTKMPPAMEEQREKMMSRSKKGKSSKSKSSKSKSSKSKRSQKC